MGEPNLDVLDLESWHLESGKCLIDKNSLPSELNCWYCQFNLSQKLSVYDISNISELKKAKVWKHFIIMLLSQKAWTFLMKTIKFISSLSFMKERLFPKYIAVLINGTQQIYRYLKTLNKFKLFLRAESCRILQECFMLWTRIHKVN